MKNTVKRKALVIGAGIHGTTMAVELARDGHEVTIIDGRPGMLQGTSYATHNRLHLGYHYPRSKETGEECRKGYAYFVEHFPDCLVFPDFYYLIAREGSNVNAEQYRNAMADLSLECNSIWPDGDFVARDMVEDCFKVREACFNLPKLTEQYELKFKELGVKAVYNFELKKADRTGDQELTLESAEGRTITVDADIIINCTYAFTNNVQKAFSVYEDLTPYKMEDTEIVVVESKETIPALTIMDGPFMTILPYAGHENEYLVYDKLHSVQREGYSIEHSEPETRSTNWEKMKEHGKQYFPFFENLEYKSSVYGSRPISVKASGDSRATKIVKHDYPIDFFSVLEGKFVSAPLVAESMIKTINRDKNALFGHTGFIGSNLKNDFVFDDFYNSKNVEQCRGKSYDLVVSTANSAARWKANRQPEIDLASIERYIDCIKTIKAKRFVLISTIDVYEVQVDIDEDSPHGSLDKNPYGKHRKMLEDFVKDHFDNYLILRLPVTYGMNLKKNVLYDALNEKGLDKIPVDSVLQFYNVKNLMKDINLALIHGIKVLNCATEPIKVSDVFEEAFGMKVEGSHENAVRYDMKTKYASLFGDKKDYAYNRVEVLNELKQFKIEYENKCV